MDRRCFIFGLGALIAAPAVVKATSLMPVKTFAPEVVNGGVGVFYVNQDYVGTLCNGMSPERPFRTFQQALEAASKYLDGCMNYIEINLASGVYDRCEPIADRHNTIAIRGCGAAETILNDPYMKASDHSTIELRDLGILLTQRENAKFAAIQTYRDRNSELRPTPSFFTLTHSTRPPRV